MRRLWYDRSGTEGLASRTDNWLGQVDHEEEGEWSIMLLPISAANVRRASRHQTSSGVSSGVRAVTSAAKSSVGNVSERTIILSARASGAVEHGPTWEKNVPNSHTLCKCGREFIDERGFLVHIGRMNKLSSMVLSKREEVLAGKPE